MHDKGIIMVLGVTGAGKSYFINKLRGHKCVKEGHSLQSETSKCEAVQILLDQDDDTEEKTSITVVDTPGFDDTNRSALEVLEEITEFLAAQHALGIPLKGVLYLHKITENRMTSSSKMYLAILEALIGEMAIPNLVLVTTMWGKLRDEDYGDAMRREQELMDDYWQPLESKGSYVAQFDGTSESAFSFVWQLMGKDRVVLQIQKEIVDEKKYTSDTSAGAKLIEEMVALSSRGGTGNSKPGSLGGKPRKGLKSMDWLRRDKPPGPRIKDRIKGELRSTQSDSKKVAVSVLVAILNITLFVVQFVT
ncbi:P-loop containing nucleoside triphosphate hydrolase protein [Rhypophila decipiens]